MCQLWYTLRGTRRVDISLTYGASTIRYPLGTGNDLNLWIVASYIVRILQNQWLENLVIVGKLIDDSNHSKVFFCGGVF